MTHSLLLLNEEARGGSPPCELSRRTLLWLPAAGAGDGIRGGGGGFFDHVVHALERTGGAGPAPEFIEGGGENFVAGGGIFKDEIAFEFGARSPWNEEAGGAAAGFELGDATSDNEFVGAAGGLALPDVVEELAEIVFETALEVVGEDLAGVFVFSSAAGKSEWLNDSAIVAAETHIRPLSSGEGIRFGRFGRGTTGGESD